MGDLPLKSKIRCLTDDADGQELLDRMMQAVEVGRCNGDFCEICPYWAGVNGLPPCRKWLLGKSETAEEGYARHCEAWRRRIADIEMEAALR